MIAEIEISKLVNGYNPRKNMGDMESLVNSIKERGILNPILVRKLGDKYEIVAGGRRRMAAETAGLKTIPCLIRDISDEDAFHLAFIDNKERNNLNALEEAMHFAECQKKGMTQQEIGDKYKLDKGTISSRISLLSLPNIIQNLLSRDNNISTRHTYEISKILDPEDLKKIFDDNKEYFDNPLLFNWNKIQDKDLINIIRKYYNIEWLKIPKVEWNEKSIKIFEDNTKNNIIISIVENEESNTKKTVVSLSINTYTDEILNTETDKLNIKTRNVENEDIIEIYGNWTHLYKDELSYRQNLQIDLANKVINDEMSVKTLSGKVKGLKDELKERDDKIVKLIEEGKKKQEVLEGIYFKDASNMSEVEDNSVHLIVTSPPYFAGKKYEKGVTFEEYQNMLERVFKECYRVLAPSCRMFINMGDIPNLNKKGAYRMARMLDPMMEELGFRPMLEIIWKKDDPWVSNKHVKREGQHGYYYTLPSTEHIFSYVKPGDRRKIVQSIQLQSELTPDDWKTYVSGEWTFPSVKKNDDHPAKFPIELPHRLIKMYSFIGDTILDPFLGSGTTIRAARILKRKGIGYEKEEPYKELIRTNLNIENESNNKEEIESNLTKKKKIKK